MMRYKIGDMVWQAYCDSKSDWVTCPDCCGSGFLVVIMGTGEHVRADCECCRRGIEYPGKILQYEYVSIPKLITITGIEINEENEAEYKTGCYCGIKESDLFDNEKDAYLRGTQYVDNKRKQNEEEIKLKYKRDKSWVWHVHYHRRQIKEHERKMEYHKRKLAISIEKANVDDE